MTAIQLLHHTAPAEVTCTLTHPTALDVWVPIPQGGGTEATYNVRVRSWCKKVHVYARGQLPRACPERHINGNGSLCLGRNRTPPTSGDEAVIWWKELKGYLVMQDLASLTQRWPSNKSWAHGEPAAQYQQEFENRSALMPAAIVEASEGTITPPSPRSPCLCGSGKQFGHCHSNDLEHLRALLRLQKSAERRFWGEWMDRPCCGTMRNCPLRRTAA